MDTKGRCRLLRLPAELRNRIYEYALAPTGTICLSTSKSKRFATSPVVAPALLATCKQINEEATGVLYSENSICISVDAHDTCWPTISESRLPQRILEKLQHICIILDCTAYFRASYEDVDWCAFTALTSLRTLRIAVVNLQNTDDIASALGLESFEGLFTQIYERIPATTNIVYGTRMGSGDRDMLERVVELRKKTLRCAEGYFVDELNGIQLAAVASSMPDVQRGCKSGGIAMSSPSIETYT